MNALDQVRAALAPYRGTRANGLPAFVIDPATLAPGSPLHTAHEAMLAAEADALAAISEADALAAQAAELDAWMQAALADADNTDEQAFATRAGSKLLLDRRVVNARQRASAAHVRRQLDTDAYWSLHNKVASQMRELDALARAIEDGGPPLLDHIRRALGV